MFKGNLITLFHLEYLPAPVLVRLVAGDVVEVPQTLDGLRPQEVVRVVGLHVEVCGGTGFRVKVSDLRGEKGRLPGERHVARVRHLLRPCELQRVKLWELVTEDLTVSKN